MIYYILSLHLLWATYAVFVNQNINAKNGIEVAMWKNALAFVLNFIACPIAIGIAAFNEIHGVRSLL